MGGQTSRAASNNQITPKRSLSQQNKRLAPLNPRGEPPAVWFERVSEETPDSLKADLIVHLISQIHIEDVEAIQRIQRYVIR